MWEITIIASIRDIPHIDRLEQDIFSAYRSSGVMISRVESDDEYIVSIAVPTKYTTVIQYIKLCLSQMIVRVVKYEYYRDRLIVSNNDILNDFIINVLVSVGSELEVLQCLHSLVDTRVHIRSYVRFVLKDMVAKWDTFITTIKKEFRGISGEEIYLEFLKYIVDIMEVDDISLFITIDMGYYRLYTLDHCIDMSISIDQEADFIIAILDARPREVILCNYKDINGAMYRFLQYVFSSKFRVEV